MFVITTESGIPETGEWVYSPAPNMFTICLNNFSDHLPGAERVAFALELGDQKPDGDMYETQTNIKALYMVDGKEPGDEIEPTDDAKAFLSQVTDRLGAALNQWHTELPEEQKQEIWQMHREIAMKKMLESILGCSLDSADNDATGE